MRHAQWFASRFRHAFGPTPGPIGIEYRDGFVRMAQVARDRRSQVLASACVAYDVEAPERSVEQVEHALRASGFRGRECVVVAPFDAVRCATVTVPQGDDAAILDDVRRSMTERFGFGRAHCDFLRLGTLGESRCEIAAVVADRDAIERIVHPLIDAGFWPDAVEPSFVSVARTCSRTSRRASDRSRVRMAVDLHAGGATALLLQGQLILHAVCCTRRAAVIDAVDECRSEAERLFGVSEPCEVRLAGTDAYDAALGEAIEHRLGVAVRHDDEVGMLASAFAEIGIHATDRCGAAAWAGALGAAFRPLGAALRDSVDADDADERSTPATLRREAA